MMIFTFEVQQNDIIMLKICLICLKKFELAVEHISGDKL